MSDTMGALRCTSSARFCILRLSPTLLSTTFACSVTLQTTQRNSVPKAKTWCSQAAGSANMRLLVGSLSCFAGHIKLGVDLSGCAPNVVIDDLVRLCQPAVRRQY